MDGAAGVRIAVFAEAIKRETHMQKILSVVLACLLLLLVVGFTQTAPKQQVWEYRVEHVTKNHAKKLNELSVEGWEFVTATERGDMVSSSTLYFKRPKQ